MKLDPSFRREFRYSGDPSLKFWGYLLGGVGLLLAAAAGFFLTLRTRGDQVQLTLTTTLPTIFAVGLFIAAYTVRRTPRSVIVTSAGVTVVAPGREQHFPWERIDTLIRVNFDFVAAQHEDPYAPWGTSLPEAESRIEQVVFAHRRLREYAEVQDAITHRPPNRHIDEFFVALTKQYPGYYRETYSYAHELVEVPTRLVIGAAREIMVTDVAPDLTFFQGLMPWLRMGHWPLGWGGVEWPKGELILW